MKNTKTKIILSAIIFLSVIGFIGTANAAVASLYISPATLTKTAGDAFSVSVGFNALGNKVCAAEGTLVFNNLTCQSIIVAGDVTLQSSPTCSNPYFLIGVPSCTTADKALFTVAVKAGNAGTASVSLTGVDVIGEGVSVGSASIGGNYIINAVSKPTLTPTSTQTPEIQTPETTTAIPSKEEEKVMVVQPEERQTGERVSFLAAIGNIATFGTGNVWVGILAGLVIFAILVYVIYMFIYRKRKNSGKI